MSVKILQTQSSDEKTYALLKTECGIEITEPSIDYGRLTANFKFPGMAEAVSLTVKKFSTGGSYLIVDSENIMLCEIYVKDSLLLYYGNGNAADVYNVMIFNNNGTPGDIIGAADNVKFTELFEICTNSYLNNHDSETELIPLYGYDQNHNCYKMPNFYIARNKMFYAAQTLVDETGAKYVTLGGCILYKM